MNDMTVTDAAATQKVVDLKAMLSAQPPETQKRIATYESRIVTIGRKSTEDTLDIAGYLTEIAGKVDDALYKAWVKERCDITPRHASNYVAVHARLAGRRDELLKSRVAPTVLFRLARASDETVEAVLAEYAAGQRLTVAEVNRMIAAEGEEPEKATDPHDVGGAKGLRKLAQARAAAEAQEFVAAVAAMESAIKERLAEAAGKRIGKETLRPALVKPARLARCRLHELVCPIEVTQYWDGSSAGLGHGRLPDSRWRVVDEMLFSLGGIETWPGNLKLTRWLEDEVLPVLRFVTKGTPFGEPRATIAARAEAEAAAQAEEAERQEADADEPELVDAPALAAAAPAEETAVATVAAAQAGPAPAEAAAVATVAVAEAQAGTSTVEPGDADEAAPAAKPKRRRKSAAKGKDAAEAVAEAAPAPAL